MNTTCVDGSIVFIDPISFSILKKIQLRYTDYELPYKVRHSIKNIMNVFNTVGSKKGKKLSIVHVIFEDVIRANKDEISIKDLVEKLVHLDPS